MKIKSLEIRNFRGLAYVAADRLGDLVVIAGPNGSGKSCLLDAIRLVKSSYGGYQDDEYSQWMGEFQIGHRTNKWELLKLLRRTDRSSLIELGIELSDREIEYLRAHQRTLTEDAAVRRIWPHMTTTEWRRFIQSGRPMDVSVRANVDAVAKSLTSRLDAELKKPHQLASIEINTNGQVTLTDNLALATIWRIYEPERVGVIDYHGPHRNYARESIAGIHLNLQTQDERQKQHALYNYGNKYTNIKSEMAAEFVRELLRDRAEVRPNSQARTLQETLKELFRTFFPDKKFAGATTDENGDLIFPVEAGDATHDINELSSGEKEILYGYLRLRKSAPRDSIILLDEPELHLNPRLIQGLPQFYNRRIVREMNNQMWLVTHSDALLREALATPHTTVMHMQEARDRDTNQLQSVEDDHDVDRAVIELVGDVAGYHPGGKVVIFEGREAGFDVRMTERLFPRYERSMNFIAGGNRAGVERLHRVLDTEDDSAKVKVYCIVDRDLQPQMARGRRLQWDAYHIENYLLDSTYIYQVLRESTVSDVTLDTAGAIDKELLTIARETVEKLVAIKLQRHINDELVRQIRIRGEPGSTVGSEMAKSAQESVETVQKVVAGQLTEAGIGRKEREYRRDLERALKTEEWKKVFRGRDILKAFVNRHCQGVTYERFRDMVVNRMRHDGHEPGGMRTVLRKIAEQD